MKPFTGRHVLAELTGVDPALLDDEATIRDVLVGALTEAGAPPAPCEGTFYVWWRLPGGLTAASLLDEHRVVVAAGEGFGARGEGWARLSLAIPDADVAEGASRLVRAVQSVG